MQSCPPCSKGFIALRAKLLGLSTAAVIAGISFFGATNSSEASFVCSLAAPTAGNGQCWNELDSNFDSSGDFRNDAGWASTFIPGGGPLGNWTNLDFTTTNLLNSQFATQSAFGAQDADKVETTLEGSDWFGQDLTFVSQGDISGRAIDLGNLGGNVLYIHVGGYSMAWLFGGNGPFPFEIEGVGKGLSNYRVYSTVTAVPLPAALPLFGAALLGLGYLGRRRMRKAT